MRRWITSNPVLAILIVSQAITAAALAAVLSGLWEWNEPPSIVAAPLVQMAREPATVHTPNKPDVEPGRNIVSLPLFFQSRPATFIAPGMRIDILIAVRLKGRVEVLPLLTDVPIVAMDSNLKESSQPGLYSSNQIYTLAVDAKQSLLIRLAQERKCEFIAILDYPDGEAEKLGTARAIAVLLDESNFLPRLELAPAPRIK